MSQIPALTGGRRLSHDAVSEKQWVARSAQSYVEYFEDFLGQPTALASNVIAPGFQIQDTSSGGAPTLAYEDGPGGVFGMTFSSDDEAQKLTVYAGDRLYVPATKNAVFEARVAITGTFSADDRVVIGLAAARNATLDNNASHSWFKIEGANNNILVETDDGTTDNDDNDTTKDWTSGTYYVYRIDLSDLSNVRFFVDDVQCQPETMDLSQLTATSYLQPYIEMQKDAGAVTHKVQIDYIRVTYDR